MYITMLILGYLFSILDTVGSWFCLCSLQQQQQQASSSNNINITVGACDAVELFYFSLSKCSSLTVCVYGYVWLSLNRSKNSSKSAFFVLLGNVGLYVGVLVRIRCSVRRKPEWVWMWAWPSFINRYWCLEIIDEPGRFRKLMPLSCAGTRIRIFSSIHESCTVSSTHESTSYHVAECYFHHMKTELVSWLTLTVHRYRQHWVLADLCKMYR